MAGEPRRRRRPSGGDRNEADESGDRPDGGDHEPDEARHGPPTGGWVDEVTHDSPAELHAQHVRQRLEGGAPATPEAYARALDQWRRLPGAASVSAADHGEVPASPAPPTPEGPTTREGGPR